MSHVSRDLTNVCRTAPQAEETAQRKGIWPGHLSPTNKGDKGQQRRVMLGAPATGTQAMVRDI